DRVLRVDINSATTMNPNLPLINEPLAVHATMNADWEVIINEGLDRPCGIDLIENRLLVSDYATGEIIIYDMDNEFAEMHRIDTGEPGITGIKIGPDGNIWYTNRPQNKVMMVAPDPITSVKQLSNHIEVSITPNPTTGLVNIHLPQHNGQLIHFSLFSASGQQIFQGKFADQFETLDLSDLQNGVYFVRIFN